MTGRKNYIMIQGEDSSCARLRKNYIMLSGRAYLVPALKADTVKRPQRR